MHATEFLQKPRAVELKPVVAVFGSEAYLRAEVLHALCERLDEDGGGGSVTRYPGEELDLRTLTDELRTVSMWGDQRVVIVDDADEFVSENRAALEKYAAAPARKSILILSVKSWPKNTRLAKAVAKSGLDIDCAELKGAALLNWLSETASKSFDKQLSRQCAGRLVELAGNQAGRLTQELAKVCAYAGDRERITEADIMAVAGDWATKTAFQMIDEVNAGRPNRGLELLDQLLAANEPPQKILGAIVFSYRRLANAVEDARHGMRLKEALAKAGVFRNRIDSTNSYLRRIGRSRAEQILPWLVETDVALKGGSRGSDRVLLEELLVRLSGRLSSR